MNVTRKELPARRLVGRCGLAIVSLACVLALSACGYPEDVWSSIAGDNSGGEEESNPPPPPMAESSDTGGAVMATPAPAPAPSPPPSRPSQQMAAAPAAMTPMNVPSGPDTGTFVGQKVRDLRGDLQRLSDSMSRHNGELQRIRSTLSADANTYYTLVGAINSRLQVGTTPGNPQLVAQFNQAQSALDRMNDDLGGLNSMSNQTASDLALAAYLLEEIKAAFALQGAVDEDHRQLTALQNQVNSDVVVIQQMMRTVTDDITRQNNYIATERHNLSTLSLAVKNGELYGQSFAARPPAVAAATGATPAYAAATPASIGERRPLVTIRFDRPNVPYEQALYTAVSRTLERRPNAVFDLVAVSPSSGSAAQVSLNADESKRNVETVMRSLSKMGLPADRVAVSSITSGNVRNSEVQIFVR